MRFCRDFCCDFEQASFDMRLLVFGLSNEKLNQLNKRYNQEIFDLLFLLYIRFFSTLHKFSKRNVKIIKKNSVDNVLI